MDFLLVSIIILAIFVSTISIIAGFGGGILLIPLLTVIYGFPMKMVVGTVLISLMIPATIGTIGAWRRKEIDFRLGLLFEIPTALGVYLGAKMSSSIPDVVIKGLFGAIAVLLSLQMINKARKQVLGSYEPSRFWTVIGKIPPVIELDNKREEGKKYRISITSLVIAGLVVGMLAGILGVGGGWIKSPLMILAFGVPAEIATGTAIFMILITALTGGLTHMAHGQVDMALLLALSIGLAIGATLGNYLKPKFKQHQITQTIGGVLLVVALTMLSSLIVWIENQLGIFSN